MLKDSQFLDELSKIPFEQVYAYMSGIAEYNSAWIKAGLHKEILLYLTIIVLSYGFKNIPIETFTNAICEAAKIAKVLEPLFDQENGK